MHPHRQHIPHRPRKRAHPPRRRSEPLTMGERFLQCLLAMVVTALIVWFLWGVYQLGAWLALMSAS